MTQVAIFLTGLVAVWLSQSSRPARARWACWAGLAGQPFWLYATGHADQWGMFALSVCYTGAWAKGAWTHWLRRYFNPH